MLNNTKEIVERIIHIEINNILLENKQEKIEINNEHKFTNDLGLSSLDLARLIAQLEIQLNADPFLELVSITSVKTVNDLINAYLFYSNNQSIKVSEQNTILEQYKNSRVKAKSKQ